MTAVRISAGSASEARADTLVLVAVRRPEGLELLTPDDAVPDDTAQSLVAAATAVSPAGCDPIRLPGAVSGRDGVVTVAPLAEPVTAEAVRRAVGAALRDMPRSGEVAIVPPRRDDEMLRATIEGAALGSYRFRAYRQESPAPAPPRRAVVLVGSSVTRHERELARRANLIAGSVALARDLVNTPPNDLSPADLAHVAATTFAGTSVTVKVWDDRTLRRGGFGGLTAVGQGSARGPRLVRLTYRNPRARRKVALVGKGITFDSGGLSLKPAKSMETMKSDMGGAAAVLATVRVVAELHLPVNVTGWMAIAENMPSGTAQRPGDVITIRGGRTVEVLNTDAEGRLVLADALVAAAADRPDLVVDIATLTGAQLVALGSRIAGVMGTDDALRDELVAAADACGESLWPMPLPPELRASLDSQVADIANIGERNGGMMTAALFLKEFVPDGLPWAHLDIAGPAFNEAAPHGYTPRGGTGFGVRTLTQFLIDGGDATGG